MSVTAPQLFKDQHPLVLSCPAFNELRLAEELQDLKIELMNSPRLRVHRVVLAARIPFLRASLNAPNGNDISVLKWSTVPLSLANELVRYVYTGEVEMTQSNVRGMVGFARMVQLPVLEDWGMEYILKTMNTEDLANIWDFAKSFNMEKLMDGCVRQMKVHFESFVLSDLFGCLPPDTVLTLLRSDDLAVSSEKNVFAAVAQLACACNELEEKKLKLHVPAMLQEIQWHQTSSQFRDNFLNSHPIFQKNAECLRLMARIANWVGAADNSLSQCSYNQHMRSFEAIFVFGNDAD